MDIVKFDTGEFIFRLPPDHEYSVGQHGIVSITRVNYLFHHHDAACRSPAVKNLSGRFPTYLEGYTSHGPVSKKSHGSFGRRDEMYHLHGSVSIHHGIPYFKGCAGLPSVRAIAEDLFLKTPECEVHMGVFKVCVGRRLDTSQGCFLELCVGARFKCLKVRRRMMETSQSVMLRVDQYDPSELPYLEGELVPCSLDVSVSSTGVVVLRFSWSRCKWNEEREAAVLRFCGWMGDRLRECC